jgi:glycosyltransferase involved in cell wall biosynthesis
MGDAARLPDARYVFLVDVLPRNHAGRTASILTKTRLLAERGGQESVIVTAYDSSQLDDISHGLRERGLLVDGVEAHSLHDFYPDPTELDPGEHHRPFEEPGMTWIVDDAAGQFHFFEHGLHRLSKRIDHRGHLIVLDWFNPAHNRTRSDEFWSNGVQRRTVFFDLHYGVARQELLHRRDGSVRLSIWWAVDPVTKVRSPERIVAFDLDGRPERELGSYPEVIHACLDGLIGDQPAFLSCEARRVDEWVLDYRRPNVRQLHVLHNAHLRPPYDDVHKIRPIYTPLLTSPNVDATVFLTHRQKREAEAHFGPHPSYQVIPHSVPEAVEAEPVARDPKLVVMMARLDQQKQIDHAIDAFAQVVKAVPDARLEIYGRGTADGALRAQIRRLGLTRSVKLGGFTSDPMGVYRHAGLSLLTSKYEGFGLVLVESLQHGCPVVSYDIAYGPADIVIDGTNGRLVPPGNKHKLARAIIDLLRDPTKLAEFSANAPASVATFSEQAFVDRWTALFTQLAATITTTAPSVHPGEA